jgi:hypothetical protein
MGMRGNIDQDPAGTISVSDLVYLVTFMFSGGPAPVCFLEADVNASGVLDVSDLVWLVSYMFQSGYPPYLCP